MFTSKILDMRDIDKYSFDKYYDEMISIFIRKQPYFSRYFISKSKTIREYLGLSGVTRKWEYPWAITMSLLTRGQKLLDVGGGGSPFAYYLHEQGHDVTVADPFLNKGMNPVFNREKSVYRNIRSISFRLFLKITGVRAVWGLNPKYVSNEGIKFFPYGAEDLNFSDNMFDRVFCLSVMEHISVTQWPACMKEFARVLKPGGRLLITMDMSSAQANDRQYKILTEATTLKLIGNPDYTTPISSEDKQNRHPGITYETMGLAWEK